MRLTQAAARTEPRTNGTQRTSLYCTWRPSGLATRLHGQRLIDLYLHTKFHWNRTNFLWTDGRTYLLTDGHFPH